MGRDTKPKIQRILAFLIDHLIGCCIMGVIFWTVNWDSILISTDSNIMRPFETFYSVLAFGMIYYLLKDIRGGISIGKRVLKIAVRDITNSDIIPGIFRLIIRNITTIIWPIELILVVLAQRKLGDKIARTQVIKVPQQNQDGINIT